MVKGQSSQMYKTFAGNIHRDDVEKRHLGIFSIGVVTPSMLETATVMMYTIRHLGIFSIGVVTPSMLETAAVIAVMMYNIRHLGIFSIGIVTSPMLETTTMMMYNKRHLGIFSLGVVTPSMPKRTMLFIGHESSHCRHSNLPGPGNNSLDWIDMFQNRKFTPMNS